LPRFRRNGYYDPSVAMQCSELKCCDIDLTSFRRFLSYVSSKRVCG
jgi:hypothetical protein